MRRRPPCAGSATVGEVKPGQRVLADGAAGEVEDVRRPDRDGARYRGPCRVQHAATSRCWAGSAPRTSPTTRREDFTDGVEVVQYDVILDNVEQPLARRGRHGALSPKEKLVLNGGDSPRHVFGADRPTSCERSWSTCSSRGEPRCARSRRKAEEARTSIAETELVTRPGRSRRWSTGPTSWPTRPRAVRHVAQRARHAARPRHDRVRRTIEARMEVVWRWESRARTWSAPTRR